MPENLHITPMGSCNFRNQQRKFGIKTDDRRRHVYVVGKTGSGKSTLLENMAVADIRSGKGVGIVDPHGEFAEKILDFIPEDRLDQVVYVNPADLEFPIAFNPLEQTGGAQYRHLIASGLMGVFKKIWPDVWSARMEYILNNTLLSLLEYPGSTLLGIMRMLSEPEYRKKIVANLNDPVVKAFWVNEFARYSQKLETEAVAAIQNKIGQFVANPLIRNILGQAKSTIDMRKIMDEGKILIANLSKGRIGEDNSRLLGAMMITRLQLAAMSRVDIVDERARRDFFLYVDEFQNFATDSFATILSEARKYHLSLTLAHQYIGQLVSDQSTTVRDAVFGNVGTIVSFRVGATDGEFLEKEFTPEFTINDLVNLPKYQIYIKLMIDGMASTPFSAQTLPPYDRPTASFRDVIIHNSQTRYGTPRSIIEERIASEWSEGTETMMGDKINRRNERSLREALSPQGVYPREHQGYAPRSPRSFDNSEQGRRVDPVRSPASSAPASPAGGSPEFRRGEARRMEPPRAPYDAPRPYPAPPHHPPARHPSATAKGHERAGESHGESGRLHDALPPRAPHHPPQRTMVDINALRDAINKASNEEKTKEQDPPPENKV